MVSPPTIVDSARGVEPAGEVERTVRRLARISGRLLRVFLSVLLAIALISAIWRPWQPECRARRRHPEGGGDVPDNGATKVAGARVTVPLGACGMLSG